jgi:hypothetical protein
MNDGAEPLALNEHTGPVDYTAITVRDPDPVDDTAVTFRNPDPVDDTAVTFRDPDPVDETVTFRNPDPSEGMPTAPIGRRRSRHGVGGRRRRDVAQAELMDLDGSEAAAAGAGRRRAFRDIMDAEVLDDADPVLATFRDPEWKARVAAVAGTTADREAPAPAMPRYVLAAGVALLLALVGGGVVVGLSGHHSGGASAAAEAPLTTGTGPGSAPAQTTGGATTFAAVPPVDTAAPSLGAAPAGKAGAALGGQGTPQPVTNHPATGAQSSSGGGSAPLSTGNSATGSGSSSASGSGTSGSGSTSGSGAKASCVQADPIFSLLLLALGAHPCQL